MMISQLQVKRGAAVVEFGKAVETSSAAEAWSNVIDLIPSKEYSAMTELFQQGSLVRDVYLIDRGLIKLTRLSESGQEMIVGLRSPGSILGAASVIVQKPHPMTAVTLTRCYLRRISPEIFLDLAKTNSQFCWHLHQVHSREVYDQADQLVGFKYLSARQRLERLLRQLILAAEHADRQKPIRFSLPLKHWELAQLVGVTPEHLSRIFRQIQNEGIMHRINGCFIVPDIRKLSDATCV